MLEIMCSNGTVKEYFNAIQSSLCGYLLNMLDTNNPLLQYVEEEKQHVHLNILGETSLQGINGD